MCSIPRPISVNLPIAVNIRILARFVKAPEQLPSVHFLAFLFLDLLVLRRTYSAIWSMLHSTRLGYLTDASPIFSRL